MTVSPNPKKSEVVKKYGTFLQHSLIPKHLRIKAPQNLVLHHNKKYWKTKRDVTKQLGKIREIHDFTDKWERKEKLRSFDKPRNRRALTIIMRISCYFYWALFHTQINNINFLINEQRATVANEIYDISIFNYFNNNYFNKYYFNNKQLQIWIQAYKLDTDYFNTFINNYNLYLFLNLEKKFNVILNFEYYKYEDDKILYSNTRIKNYKNKKKILMHTDFYDYIKRKNRVRFITKYTWDKPHYNLPWNVRDLEEDNIEEMKKKKKKEDLKKHLRCQGNLFFSFIIYEFALKMFQNFLFFFLNFDFFSKILIFKKNKKNMYQKYPNFLTTAYYTYGYELINIYDQKDKDDNIDKKEDTSKEVNIFINKSIASKVLYTDYKNLKFDMDENNESFNLKKHILDIKYYGIRMPFLFFILYMWYGIYYRQARYNFYIRADLFFQEYFSKIKYFISTNSGARDYRTKGPVGGKNTNKLTRYRYQKHFTIYHLKSYLDFAWFNNWFFFYSAYHIKLKKYYNEYDDDYDEEDNEEYNNIDSVNDYNFLYSSLLNNNNILKQLDLLNSNNIYFKEFLWGFSGSYYDMYELFNGYKLLMDTPITKFEKRFKFGRWSYLKYDDLVETAVLTLPKDKNALIKYSNKKIVKEHMLNLCSNLNYLNFYFLKDLFNFNIMDEYKQHLKILGFYEKIFYIIFLLIDPFFFKYYWRRCFPKRWYKIRNKGIENFILSEMIMQRFNVEGAELNINIPQYSFIMNFLNWRIDTGNFFKINKGYSNQMVQDKIVVRAICESRFIELVNKYNLLLQENGIFKDIKNDYHYNSAVLKTFYFDFLYNNIDYTLILFFNNLFKYLKLLNNQYYSLHKFIYSNFLYRYYIYNILLESHYYDDWFDNPKKRIFWIYKDFTHHEGPRFYKEKTDVF